jgi:hypothetical protein
MLFFRLDLKGSYQKAVGMPATCSSRFPFSTDGVLIPVVDPYSVGVQATAVSAEAQAFVVQMHEAWKDWKRATKTIKGSSGQRCASLFGSKGSILLGFIICGLICAIV